jgi:hypothetical protein
MTILSVYTPKAASLNFIKQTIKAQINSNIIVYDFNNSLSSMERSFRQIGKKKIKSK